MKKFLILFYLVLASALTPIAAKVAVREIHPLDLAFFRFSLATLLFIIVFKIRGNNFIVEKKDYLKFLVLGSLVIPINQLAFMYGITFSSASHSAVIYSCTPIITYLISIKLKHENYSIQKLIIVLLTTLGIAIIFYDNIIQTSNINFLLGDLLFFVAVISWGAFLTLNTSVVKKYGALKSITISYIIGLIIYFPIFLSNEQNIVITSLSAGAILGYLHLAIIVAFGSYFIFIYSTKVIHISTLTSLLNVTPLITILISIIFLKEKINIYFIIGSSITLLGVFLTQYFNKNNYIKES